jgi:2-(1,2-epoxy-1,2-dihydrophenyl)acetyl-CoA isomerase
MMKGHIMKFDHIIVQKEEGVTVIKLNRPKEFNAINADLLSDFMKAVEFTMDDPDTKVVVITGEGKAFCSGGDLASLKSSPDTADTLRQLIKIFNALIIGIRRMPKPVIAMINGAVAGGGISIAAACDLRICASSVMFKQAYTSAGLVPDGAFTLLVPLLIGFGKTSELYLLDPLFDAKQALEMGLVNRVVEDAELEQVTKDIALQLAKGSTVSYAIVKENLNNAMIGLLESQLELERKGMIWAGRTIDAREGIAAFLEKRKPNFIGR